MNKILICLLFCNVQTGLGAQTLFSYGPHKVESQEFLYAFRNNNPAAAGKPSEAAFKSYLQLFVNYKLKVQAAKDAGLDKAPDYIRDINSFQAQLTDQTMKRLEGIGKLSREALLRGKTDIEISQVYVAFPTLADTLTAFKRIGEAFGQLQKGLPFETVAREYGTNPVLKSSGGYTGFVTVFSLPYAAENMVYTLRDGRYSGIYKSRSGYHIFKRIGQRPNPGTLDAAQILLAFAPDATEAQKAVIRERADSLCRLLKNGASFDSLVRKYSDDKMSYYNNGRLPEFTTGDFDRAFEAAAFALPADGAVSEPVLTNYGYHIIKRIRLTAPMDDSLEARKWAAFQQKVYYSDRMDFSRTQFAENALPLLGYHVNRMDTGWLYLTGDTLLTKHGGEEYIKRTANLPLFSFKEKTYNSYDWLRYLLYRRSGELKTGPFDFPGLVRDFISASALEYYSAHLDTYDTGYRYQLREFSEGSLLFGIMQQQVWNKAGEDSAALEGWFVQHREKFVLPRSADAIAFNAPDSAQGINLMEHVRRDPSKWRLLLGNYINVNADSARFELGALSLDSATTNDGTVTLPRLQPDNNWHFYYVVKTYAAIPARNFEEARDLSWLITSPTWKRNGSPNYAQNTP
jgi:peptidyl-prolyl cis-trans isomerase SurA